MIRALSAFIKDGHERSIAQNDHRRQDRVVCDGGEGALGHLAFISKWATRIGRCGYLRPPYVLSKNAGWLVTRARWKPIDGSEARVSSAS